MTVAAEPRGRVREVFDPKMVARVWYSQSQERGRNAQNNFFFHGTTIYSYGSHFPIAEIVTRKGKTCVLFTTKTWGPTTAKHTSFVRRAIGSDTPVFNVPFVFAQTDPTRFSENLVDYTRRIKDTATKAMKAKSSKDRLLGNLEALVAEANAYAKFFGSRTRFKVPSELDLKREYEKAAKEAKAAKVRREAETKKVIAKATEQLSVWLAGGVIEGSSLLHTLTDTYLRVVDYGEGRVVETSKGAEVPLEHALRLLPLIRSGRPYKRNGHSEHVGHFVVDEITEEGMKVGCHFIKRAELERLAKELGV